ncbi:MAG: ferredoxin [Actinomycetota bacterium]|jgi:ferredoxin|nr:ferredoxin [Actinomycetota bacterium]
MGILMAGHETSLSMIPGVRYLLRSRRDLSARPPTDAALVPTAVEELPRVVPLLAVSPACVGAGMCLTTAPGHFRRVDDRSVPVVTDVPPGDEHVLAAAELCPMAAVLVRDSETGGRVAPADCPAGTSQVTAIPGSSGPSTVPRAGGPRSGRVHCGWNGFRSRNASGGSSGTATDRYGEERQTAALIPRSGSFRTPAVDRGRHTRDVTTRRGTGGPAGPRRGFGPARSLPGYGETQSVRTRRPAAVLQARLNGTCGRGSIVKQPRSSICTGSVVPSAVRSQALPRLGGTS